METKQPKARVLAYYLPQFHPIPENDEWWGKGFTEWTNVGKAKPLFPGHYQPRVPADLGYYDLRVPETRKAQADMAREYGVEGFVYWHYWFGNGKRLLERPFNEVLASGEPDFPFALAWANETWSGFYHGLRDDRQILIEQTYPGEDDYIAHFNAVLPAFKDKRYITCDGKPIFIIYHASQLPDATHFIDLWQKLAKENGLKGIYFIAHEQDLTTDEKVESRYNEDMEYGFDAINIVNKLVGSVEKLPTIYRLARKFLYKNPKIRIIPNITPYLPEVYSTHFDSKNNVFPSVLPGWDHTPRTGINGSVIVNSTPEKFQQVCLHAINNIKDKNYERKFIFIKSWNEWAEGNYMEPDLKYGKAYLEALRSTLYDE